MKTLVGKCGVCGTVLVGPTKLRGPKMQRLVTEAARVVQDHYMKVHPDQRKAVIDWASC